MSGAMSPPMSPRLRKFIGMIVILAFCAIYVVFAVTLGSFLPGSKAVQLAYYAVAGTAWSLPLFPLIKWMNRD